METNNKSAESLTRAEKYRELFRANSLSCYLGNHSKGAIPNTSWDNLRRKLKAPVILQTASTDCGAACLAMILNAFGHEIDIKGIRAYIDIERDGVSALEIVRVAKRFGLRATGVKAELDDLTQIPLPAILHWNFNHFVVLTKCSPGSITVIDPGVGRRTVTRSEADAEFTGVVLVFERDSEFRPHTGERRKWFRFIAPLLDAKQALGRVLGLSLFLKILGLLLPLFTAAVIDRVIPTKGLHTLGILSSSFGVLLCTFLGAEIARSFVLSDIRALLDEQMMLKSIERNQRPLPADRLSRQPLSER